VSAADQRIPIARLERYGKLENDVLKAGDEIRSLARFTSTQRTAFRKLLKKYKKWTGSTNLEIRFRDEVLDTSNSFTKLDLGPLLDDYSTTLQDIRSLYESGLQQPPAQKDSKKAPAPPAQSVIDKLQDALRNGSRIDFDTAMAIVPLGDDGEVANYFVHPENVVELQVSLLQYMQYYTSRSRANSATTPVTPATPRRQSGNPLQSDADYFMLVADNLDRFAQQQSTITVKQREHVPGVVPQMAKAFIRWNDTEHATLSVRSGHSHVKSASLRRKQIGAFLDRKAPLSKKAEIGDAHSLTSIRDEIFKDSAVQPLYKLSSCRSRFIGLNNSSKSHTLATLDSSISIHGLFGATINSEVPQFPFAVLQVRKEGPATSDLLSTLNASHLVERVRGFSLQYHALWQTCQPKNISAPFWIPMLSQDIRKLPPPALKRNGTAMDGSLGSPSATQGTASTNSVRGMTDSTTAVETGRGSASSPPTELEAPQLRSFRKKRRRNYAEREMQQQQQQQQRYWSEYDHPEDGEDGADAFVIYIDPNEKSTFDRLFDRIGGLFGRQSSSEDDSLPSPSTPLLDDDTSDEEDTRGATTYGTLPRASRGPSLPTLTRWPTQQPQFLPQVTAICFFASLSILTVAYILATTSRHKYVAEVDVGIMFAVACGLVLAVIGFIPLLRRTEGTWVSLGVAAGVLVVDVVASGALLTWVLG